jgi:hypothetical protein
VVKGDNEIVWRFSTLGGATFYGPADVINTFALPNLDPGDYRWRTIVYSQCPFEPHVQAFPEATFTIKQKDQ